MLEIWPSLRGWKEQSKLPIRTQRAVYGKVHRAPTDYRWIGWSSGIAPEELRLEQEFALGSEDTPITFYCWRCAPSGAYAVKCYPSRAFDAAGRPAGLEKQTVSVAGSPLPPALLAFILLARAAEVDDSIWWETWKDPRWQSPEFHLSLRESDQIVDLSTVESNIKQGLGELLEAVPPDRLAAFYGALSEEGSPALLRDQEKPLSALALAALMLPLEPALASKLTIAGNYPSTTLPGIRLQHWRGIVSPPAVAITEAASSPRKQTQQGAEAVTLLRLGLARLSSSRRSVTAAPANLSPGASYLTAFLESEERWFAPGEPGGRSLARVGPWPVVRDPAELLFLKRRVTEFIAALDDVPTGSPQRRHLETKADLLRALFLVLCPGQDGIAIGPPLTGMVPALLFASRIDSEDWQALTQYTPAQFQQLARQSLHETRVLPLAREVRSWMQRCAESEQPATLRQYAEAALKSL